jgi:catalase
MKKIVSLERTTEPTLSTENLKASDLRANTEDGSGHALTTNQGLPVNDNQSSLRVGDRGPTLLEDFHLREKITHFDHERIPERVVHARGSAAHGFFQVYKNLSRYTKAAFLQDPSQKTPVFVRFSTVAGSRGSSDLARDVRGFAVKFYTEEGNFDLVGNNMPVFFIQDAMKFPDLIHAVKPEQDNEIPQAASAHDTFWDFISLMPESMHMIMWAMSDRAIPRSYRMMEGFGVHTFRFVDAGGRSSFVKFHWKPLLGMHSVLWEEAQKISGMDPDFHRRDLWEAIENGAYPEWELGIQVIEEADQHSFPFDLLDPTKLIPEELVPVERVGKLTLNRNPESFFAETEQVAFHPGHLVPGIDFSDDPLLQGRLFSYLDTQLTRLGGPNFHEIPINRPAAPVHNHQRDGLMRQTINRGKANYEPNTIGGGCPMQVRARAGAFTSAPALLQGNKVRARSEKFFDHFSQASLFFRSQSAVEKEHIVNALRFELGKVERPPIRERMVGMLAHVDRALAERVAAGLGMSAVPEVRAPLNHSIPADGDPKRFEPRLPQGKQLTPSPALSMANTRFDTIVTRKVAILAADGANISEIRTVMDALVARGARGKIVAPTLGVLKGSDGEQMLIDHSLLTTSSVLFDAVYLPGGKAGVAALIKERDALELVAEAFRHCKAIGASSEGLELLRAALGGPDFADAPGVTTNRALTAELVDNFVAAIARHRAWERIRPQLD